MAYTKDQLVEWFDTLGVQAVGYSKKRPVADGWGDPAPNSTQTFFTKQGKPRNIGWLMGPQSDGLVDFDLDLDDQYLTDKAAEILRPYQPVFVGRGGWYRHALFRYSDRLDTDQKAVRKAQHPDGGHIEWRRGGTKPDGTYKSTQSFVIGTHPDTGETLEFMGDTKPLTPEDIPVLAGMICALFGSN